MHMGFLKTFHYLLDSIDQNNIFLRLVIISVSKLLQAKIYFLFLLSCVSRFRNLQPVIALIFFYFDDSEPTIMVVNSKIK